MKLRYYFCIFLLLFFACNKSSENKPQDTGNSVDSSSVSSLTPIQITLPEAVFTNPAMVAQGKHSKAIIGRLEGLINATPKDASIYMSVYLFKDEFGLISAIRKANERGVNLHIMLDRSDRSNNTATVEKLTAIGKDIEIVGIHNDASTSAINHNKFALFSNLSTKNGEVKNVVFTSSENWQPFTEKEIQNAIILSNKGLYNVYLQYWKDMRTRAAHGMVNFKFRKYIDLKEGIEAFFYPKRENGKYYGPDPIVNILDQITDPSSTTIKIEMPFWTEARLSIVEKLRNLMSKGAKVEIVVRSNVGVHDALVDLAGEGAFVKMYNYSNVAGIKQIQIHSKVMMIQGEWNGKKTKVIITGSENYTGNALENNNENNLLLSSYHFKHPEIFKDYEENFNKMKSLPGVCCETTP